MQNTKHHNRVTTYKAYGLGGRNRLLSRQSTEEVELFYQSLLEHPTSLNSMILVHSFRILCIRTALNIWIFNSHDVFALKLTKQATYDHTKSAHPFYHSLNNQLKKCAIEV